MTRAQLLALLRKHDACDDARAWLKASEHETLQAAWDAGAAGAAARAASLKDMAGIVRSLIPDPEHLPRVEDMPDRREAKP